MIPADGGPHRIDYEVPASLDEFFHSGKFVSLAVGPLGSSKTTAGIMKILRHAAMMKPCKDGKRRSRCVWVRNTREQLMDTSIPDFLKWIPDQVMGVFRKTEKRFDIMAGDIECEVLFRGLDEAADVKKLLSLQASFFVLEEFREINEEIYRGAQGRCGRYPDKMMNGAGCVTDDGAPNKHLWGMSNPPDRDTFWEGLLTDPPANVHVTIQPSGLSPEADWTRWLPDGYYENLAEGNKPEWVSVFVHARFGESLSGKPVFAQFSRDSHVARGEMEPLMTSDPLVIGVDAGLTPAAALGQVAPDGRLLVHHALVSDGMGALRFVREKVKPVLANRFKGRRSVVVLDPAAFQRAQTDERTVADIWRSEGWLSVLPARTNSVAARVAAVDAFLSRVVDGKAGVLIDPVHASDLILALNGKYRYKINSKGQRDESPEKSHPWSDIADAFQYLCLHAGQGGGGEDPMARREVKRVAAGGGRERGGKIRQGMVDYAGLVPVRSSREMEDDARRAAAMAQARPAVARLAAHARRRWQVMRDHKKGKVEERLRECLRAREMRYDPAKLREIRAHGGSEIFMGIASTKCRTATAWLRDALGGTGADKPWSISATPVPDLPPGLAEGLSRVMESRVRAFVMEGNAPPDEAELRQLAEGMREAAARAVRHEADARAARMEKRMEDQLEEGGFRRALSEFTDDVATFPFAVLKGPVPRRRRTLAHSPSGPVVAEAIRHEWERVDPFRFYWAPWGDDIDAMPVAEVHYLARADVEGMIGMAGFDEASVRALLADFGSTGTAWLDADIDAIDESGKDFDEASGDVVAAVQLWDRIPGSMLLEWGMDPSAVPDPAISMPAEIWLAGNMVLRAVLNHDLLGRKPYFLTSFEKIPGRVDGNGVTDMVMDAQAMCNAAARALANNMGLASGPQVGVNVGRLPAGEDIEAIHPWKIWQFRDSPHNDPAPPLQFFQPGSNAAELMGVFDRFMAMADEISGIPRYLTGQHVPGAGRTSSGLSMLISNAGKSIKQVIGNIDADVIQPMLERLYQLNMLYADDPDLIGDVRVVARGAMTLVVKETEMVRKQDFLRAVLEHPAALEVVGLEGVAELMRDIARPMNGNVDRLVPPREEIERRARQAAMAAEQQAAMAAGQGAALLEDGTPAGGRQSNAASPRPNAA